MHSIARIKPVILAAGDSTRMGYPKALLPLGRDRFITHILGILRNLAMPEPVIVLGRAASIIRPLCLDWPANIQVNPDPDRGQLSSIQLGLMQIGSEFNAGMIWPVDQPAVSEELVRRLVQLFVASRPLIACPRCGERRGHPAIFHRSLFQEFMDAPLQEGPKKILLRHQPETSMLPTDEIGTVQDIDTPEDYQSLTGESLASALARVEALKND